MAFKPSALRQRPAKLCSDIPLFYFMVIKFFFFLNPLCFAVGWHCKPCVTAPARGPQSCRRNLVCCTKTDPDTVEQSPAVSITWGRIQHQNWFILEGLHLFVMILFQIYPLCSLFFKWMLMTPGNWLLYVLFYPIFLKICFFMILFWKLSPTVCEWAVISWRC